MSLVPSLTETLYDLGLGGNIKGVTRFCVRPPEAREGALIIGGTKDPDVPAIVSLRPDLVLADEDENKAEHVAALRGSGIRVHVTRIETIGDVVREISEIGRLTGRVHEAQKHAAEISELEAQTRANSGVASPVRCFVPIWKRPLMTMGGRTYMADLLRCVGGRNVFDDANRKYFEASWDEVRAQAPAAVLLPTEPYRFRETDRAEFAQHLGLDVEAVKIVDGQAFTWFGAHTRRGIEVMADTVSHLRRESPSQKP